jgi:Ca2+-binding RTX toxin-like protein
VFNEGAGSRVGDFTQGEDRIDLSRWGVTSFDQLEITGAIIRYQDEVTRVEFGTNGTFTAEDFIFVGGHNAHRWTDVTDNTIIGTDGNDHLTGTSGNDLIYTGEGLGDNVQAGDGDDVIIISGNHTNIQVTNGGNGSDVFVFNEGAGSRVGDFTQGEDRIDLSRWGVTSFDELEITGAMIRYQDEVTRVEFGTNGTFIAEDFIFAAMATDPLAIDEGPIYSADTGWTNFNGETIIGTDGNDRLSGTYDNDLIYTGEGIGDNVNAGDGDDVIIVSGNHTNLQITNGGNGSDVFVFNAGAGSRVGDFTQGEDRIDLSRWGATSFDQLEITDSMIRYQDEVTRVEFGTTGTFTADDFIFV